VAPIAAPVPVWKTASFRACCCFRASPEFSPGPAPDRATASGWSRDTENQQPAQVESASQEGHRQRSASPCCCHAEATDHLPRQGQTVAEGNRSHAV
jgi:hypothetical protein